MKFDKLMFCIFDKITELLKGNSRLIKNQGHAPPETNIGKN